jgi:hypothetical protein
MSQHAALKQQDFAAVKYSSKMLEVKNTLDVETLLRDVVF